MQKLSYELVLDQKKSKYDIGLSQKFYWTGIAGIAILLLLIKILEIYDINIGDTELFKYVMIGLLICIGIGWLYGLFAYNGENRIIRGFITFDENNIRNKQVSIRLSQNMV
jgi:hypothetical protein